MKPRSSKAAGNGRGRKPLVVLDDVDTAVAEVEELHRVMFPKLRSVLAELRRSLRDTRGGAK